MIRYVAVTQRRRPAWRSRGMERSGLPRITLGTRGALSAFYRREGLLR